MTGTNGSSNGNSDPVVIVEAARTPMGSWLSTFRPISAVDLGVAAAKGVMSKSGLDADKVDEVIMGCVLPGGLGQAPARQVCIKSGLSKSTTATTVNKVCGSGMRAVMMGVNQILVGESDIVLAGGMESMSNAPLMTKRPGKREEPDFSDPKDHMFWDGLFDAYEEGTPMVAFAETTAEKYGFTREDQDNFTIESVGRAQAYMKTDDYSKEVVPVTVKDGDEERVVSCDEPVERSKVDKIPKLKPCYKKEGGTITAANASGIADGAAVLLLMKESTARSYNLTPRARIVSQAAEAREPEWFTIAPVLAVESALKKANWTKTDVDLYEVNEAFAVVAMSCMKELGLPHEKVNVHGGAVAMGHPLGASGARILVTLLNALEARNLKKGVATACIGGGEATAMAIELL